MGLLAFIEKIRMKPERVRYKIAIALSLIIICILTLVWFSIHLLFNNFVFSSEENSELSPFSIIKSSALNLYEEFKK